jgi:hypothetical protein
MTTGYSYHGGPALAAWANDFLPLDAFGQQGKSGQVECFGYAGADAVRVVVRLANGGKFVTPTIATGWTSGARLFAVRLPESVYNSDKAFPKGTVAAYDAAGHLIAQVPLTGA